jgi:peroxiredoxin
MPAIEPGRKAPAFSLQDQSGKTHRLKDYAGRPVVLYFYPKDERWTATPGPCWRPSKRSRRSAPATPAARGIGVSC